MQGNYQQQFSFSCLVSSVYFILCLHYLYSFSHSLFYHFTGGFLFFPVKILQIVLFAASNRFLVRQLYEFSIDSWFALCVIVIVLSFWNYAQFALFILHFYCCLVAIFPFNPEVDFILFFVHLISGVIDEIESVDLQPSFAL